MSLFQHLNTGVQAGSNNGEAPEILWGLGQLPVLGPEANEQADPEDPGDAEHDEEFDVVELPEALGLLSHGFLNHLLELIRGDGRGGCGGLFALARLARLDRLDGVPPDGLGRFGNASAGAGFEVAAVATSLGFIQGGFRAVERLHGRGGDQEGEGNDHDGELGHRKSPFPFSG